MIVGMERTTRGKTALLMLGAALFCTGVWGGESGSETLANREANATCLDRFHDYFSTKLIDWSDALDRSLSDALGHGDANGTASDAEDAALREERSRSDRFFQTRKYLDETSQTYIRMRFAASTSSLYDDRSHLYVRLHLPFFMVQKRLRFFVQDVNEENAKDLVRKTPRENGSEPGARPEESSPKFGLSYFAPGALGVETKYSVGLSGLHPYARARFHTVWNMSDWVFEPVETLQYSERSDFSEHTDLYFDTEPRPGRLFRIQLYRGTQAHRDGMYYGAAVSYEWIFSRHTGVRLVQSFAGDTAYTYTPRGSGESVRFRGVNRYTTALGYRRNLWRPWFFVEVIPSVGFSRADDYRPDYALTFFVDAFFGNYR